MITKEYKRQRSNPGALINVDYEGLEQYRNKRKMKITLKEQEQKIAKLESSVEEIKGMLIKLLEAGNNK